MAEENDGASKTEEATPRKLEEARRKGDVPKTQDLAPFAALAASVAVLATLGGPLSRDLAEAMMVYVAQAHALELADGGAVEVMRRAALAAAPAIGAVMLAAAVAGAAGNLVQHGLLWSGEKIKFDLKKVSPLSGFKRLFGADALIQFAKTFIKLIATGAVVWFAIKSHLTELQGLSALNVLAMLPLTRDLLWAITWPVLMLLAVMAGGDWLLQRFRWTQRQRMTKQELKEDFKQSEGDPHVRAKLRQMRAEIAKRRMMQTLPTATVVVMNPTHYAVALRYEPRETAAPVCVAKGLDDLALRIRAVAEEHGVAVVEDPPLARMLYAAVDVDETIPREHFEAVAQIIGFILGGREKRTAPALRP
jgi:flagellar biosynthetic protein FlhB